MKNDVDDPTAPPPPPRTRNVLAMLALMAVTFSYLGAYAVPTALVAEQVMSPWPREHDPRPRWLLIGFCVTMLVLMTAGEALRRLSRNEFRRIDAMVDGGEGQE
jgi:hypothetical protein